MPTYTKKYYTYKDEFKEQDVGLGFCFHTMKQIIKTYKKESLFRALSSIAQSIGLGNDLQSILRLQQQRFNIPTTREPIIIHRQAVCVIYQFLFSISDNEYGNNGNIGNRDIFLMFILSNQITELVERDTLSIKKARGKKMFFTSIKDIHYIRNKDDLQAGFYLFKKYYERMVNLNREMYNSIIKEKFGFEIIDYLKILDLIEQRKIKEIFSLFNKYAVLDFDKTHEAWEKRALKLNIPREFLIFQKYPLIKINGGHLVTDLHSLFASLFKNLYQTLLEFDNVLFKGDFGKNIVEPTIKDLLKEIFVDENVKPIKVGSKKREYGDFGLIYNDCIFLFEIKSSLLNDASIYTDKYEVFMKIFNDKFVVKEGIHQQVRKIKLIENHYEHFCSLSEISQQNRYTIYPILVSFDESLMSFYCNWYLSMRFEVFKKICNLHLNKIKLANCHSTVTYNEIFRMRYIEKSPTDRLKLLQKYSDDKIKHPISLSFYLQELNAFTFSKIN